MKAYLISSPHEISRTQNIDQLKKMCPYPIKVIEAVYPSSTRVPFAARLIAASKQRMGRALMTGELGCLLSHRKAWQQLLRDLDNDSEHALIFESDSKLMDPDALKDMVAIHTPQYDLFFWGAWEGHMKLFRSSVQQVSATYRVGEPFIKTVYCSYGYSLNRAAAQLLLKRTAKISYPVDQFKRFFKQKELRLGGIVPEVIIGNTIGSTIRGKENILLKKIFLASLDVKNAIICRFK